MLNTNKASVYDYVDVCLLQFLNRTFRHHFNLGRMVINYTDKTYDQDYKIFSGRAISVDNLGGYQRISKYI